jgi:hypothetical protein
VSRYLSALAALVVCAATASASELTLVVTPQSLTFSAAAGGENPPPAGVTVTKQGRGKGKWGVRESAGWLSAALVKGKGGSFEVVVDISGLAPGVYAATVTVTNSAGPDVDVPVTLVVEESAPPAPAPPPPPPPTDPSDGQVIDVPAGGDLQAALDTAGSGAVIRLAPGATYRGPFVLRPNTGDFITITSSSGVPPEGTRITPAAAGTIARIQSATSEPAIRTSPGANRYRLVGLEFGENAGAFDEVIRLGDASDPVEANIPREIVIDRVLLIVDPLVGQKRGIGANADQVTIINSDIRGVWGAYGEDSQAICQWQSHGGLVIRNNRLEAGSEVILIGGAYPAVAGLNPDGILIEANHITRPIEWMGQSKFKVKNLLELKAGTRVTIRGNLLENNWVDAQAGPSLVFTPKHGMRVTDVLFEHNVVRQTGDGFNMFGYDYEHPYDERLGPQLERLTVRNNLFIFNPERFGGGRFMLIGEGLDNVSVSRNTIVFEGREAPSSAFYGYGAQGVTGWSMTDNVVFHGYYGVFSDSSGIGTSALQLWFHDPVFTGNVLYDIQGYSYPAGNDYPSWSTLVQHFEDPARSYYRLKAGSVYTGRGADFSLLPFGGR